VYQIHNEQGDIQDLITMQVFPPIPENREGRKYLAWVADGNKPKPMAEPQALVVDENEEKIQTKIREIAVADLISTGELPKDYK